MVVGRATEARQVGSALTFAHGVQAAQTNDQVAQSGQVLRRVSGAHRRSIFAKSHIAHVVDTFQPPMASAEGLQLGRVHFTSRTAAEDDFGFFGHREGFEMVRGAGNDGGLDGVGEAGLGGGDRKGIDLAGFMPAVALAQSEVRRGKKRLPAPGTSGPVCRRAWVDFL